MTDQAIRLPCPVFVITMDAGNWSRISAQLQHWGDCVHPLAATDGAGIRVQEWIADGRYSPRSDALYQDPGWAMTRGELGCSDSHIRIWQRIVDTNLPGAVIFEDDADVPAVLPSLIGKAWSHRDRWDLVYFGYNWKPETRPIDGINEFVVPDIADQWHVAHAYMVTNAGAARLLRDALPITLPVDVYMARLTRHALRAWQTTESRVPAVDRASSTQGIR
jgi:glycosyl transferase, family 25